MAVFSAVFRPSDSTGGIEKVNKVTALAAAASSAEIVLGTNVPFAIVAIPIGTPGATTGANINVRFGPLGLGAATAADFGIPVNVVLTFDTGSGFQSVRVFNNCTTSAVDVYVMPLSKV